MSLLSGLDAVAMDRAQYARTALVDRCPEVTVTTPDSECIQTGVGSTPHRHGWNARRSNHSRIRPGGERTVTNFYTPRPAPTDAPHVPR